MGVERVACSHRWCSATMVTATHAFEQLLLLLGNRAIHRCGRVLLVVVVVGGGGRMDGEWWVRAVSVGARATRVFKKFPPARPRAAAAASYPTALHAHHHML